MPLVQNRSTRRLTIEAGEAVHVLGRVLEHPVAAVAVLQAVHRERLEAAPAQGHHQRVACLQDLPVPPVLFHTDLEQKQAKYSMSFRLYSRSAYKCLQERAARFQNLPVLPVLLHTDLHKRGERKFQRHGLSCRLE